MTNVERITPMTFLPYIIFSPKAPYFVMTFCSGSLKRSKFSPYFLRKADVLLAPSGETPNTVHAELM